MRRIAMTTLLALATLALLARPAFAGCPGNLLRNPGFEAGYSPGPSVGASQSSRVANEWYPWAALGDPTRREQGYDVEPEFKMLVRSVLVDGWYRVPEGEYAQAFFSMYSTHTAGLYQQVSVPRGSRVTLTFWAQIYTGQESIVIEGRYPVSDLEQPLTEATRAVRGPGDYRVSIGIDPYGHTPASFGAPPPDTIVWSHPVLDVETRSYDAQGRPVDDWVQMTLSTTAHSDRVTVYTRGQPAFRTKHNDSYWDNACLTATAAETATPTPLPTDTPWPTPTRHPTPTPSPTATPTQTMPPPPTPTATAQLAAIAPIEAVRPTATPAPPVLALVVDREVEAAWLAAAGAPTPADLPGQPPEQRDSLGLVALYILNGLFVFAVLYWIRRTP